MMRRLLKSTDQHLALGLVALAALLSLVARPALADEPASLATSRNWVTALAFAPDRKTMAGFAWPVIRFWEIDSGRPSGTGLLLERDLWLAIAPDGSYRAAAPLDPELVIIVQTGKGQETLSPQEFQRQYQWRNDPKQVRFVPR